MADYDKALADIKKCLTSGRGGTKAEAAYAAAYQIEVAEGRKPQLRKKYRP
jgi:hypothetical protein